LVAHPVYSELNKKLQRFKDKAQSVTADFPERHYITDIRDIIHTPGFFSQMCTQ